MVRSFFWWGMWENGRMKNKNHSYGQSEKIEKKAAGLRMADFGWWIGGRSPRGLKMAAALGGLALGLAGCVVVPHTTIEGRLNGSPFLIKAPKDGDLTGFDLTADSNGVVRVHIDHLTVKMNPDVIGQTGAAQAAMISATGAVASNITAAAVTAALKAN
jgi:hypothetical protein